MSGLLEGWETAHEVVRQNVSRDVHVTPLTITTSNRSPTKESNAPNWRPTPRLCVLHISLSGRHIWQGTLVFCQQPFTVQAPSI